MLTYQELDSQKFINDSDAFLEQKKAVRRYRNAKALQDLLTFLFGLGAMWLGVYAVNHFDAWRPYAENLLSYTGLF